jgi:C_GCAxxG_C_C family probable redox protein
MEREIVEQCACENFESGLNCAETVATTIVEKYSGASSSMFPKIASAFGGGVGGTREELCGALAGGILAIGYFFGRTQPGGDVQTSKDLAATFRQRFLEQYSDTKCRAILDSLGPQENSSECKKLIANVAGMLSELFAEQKEKSQS